MTRTMQDSTTDITGDYLELLNLFYMVVDGQKGMKPADSRWVECHELATKLFFHASAILDLRQGTRIPLPATSKPTFFYDFASATVLARAVLDAYLTMYEVFFEPTTDDEFTFRHALWNLAGNVLREAYDPFDPTLAPKRAEAVTYGNMMRERMENTSAFKSLTKAQQEAARRGKRGNREFIMRAQAAGFGGGLLQVAWDYYSGYVHSDGSSASQVYSAKTRDDQLERFDTHMRMVLMAISKVILHYADRFPAAKAVCEANPVAVVRAEVYAGVARLLP